MLNKDPATRLSAQQVCDHKWVHPDHPNEKEHLHQTQAGLKKFNARRKFRRGVQAVLASNQFTEVLHHHIAATKEE